MKCPVCLSRMDSEGFHALSEHFVVAGISGEGEHVMWLNRYVGRDRIPANMLSERLSVMYDTSGDLKGWIVRRLVERIYTTPPHPFIKRMQHPDRSTIYGYVLEHHHFLMQWVKSCAAIMSKTDEEDVQLYEIDNIISEFRGLSPSRPSHHELLLRMGESIGITRSVVYSTEPLQTTARCLNWWQRIASECHWLETMAAMHTLELTANPNIRKMGSDLTYFDPAILENDSYPEAVRNFLREGYEADASHSMDALDLIEKHCTPELEKDVQSVVYRTVSLLDDYLMSRLKRSESYGN